MLFIRRFLALFIGVLFITSFLVVATVLRVNATLFESSFYVEHLREADFFNFAYDEVVPAATEQFSAENDDFPIDVVEASARLTSIARGVAPPEWLQAQSEQVIQELIPYVLGESDTFTLRVELADRITALGAALTDADNQQTVYELVFEGFARPYVADAIAESDLPFGIVFDADDVVDAIQAVAAQAWIQDQLAHIVGEIVPYAIGESDAFQIEMDIGGRIVVFKDEAKSLIAESNMYDVVSHPDMAAKIDEQRAAIGDAPFDIEFEPALVVRTLDAIFPADWIQGQVDGVLDQGTEFVTTTGESTVFRLDISGPARAALIGEGAQLKVLLREISAYEKVFSEGIVPTLLDQAMGAEAEDADAPLITFSVIEEIEFSVTRRELEELLRDELQTTLSTEIESQVEGALDAFTPYLMGESENFTLVFDTGGLVDGMMPALLRRLEGKVDEEFALLPACNATDAVAIAEGTFGETLPSCRPAGLSLAEVQEALGAPSEPVLTGDQLSTLCNCDVERALEGMTLDELKAAADIDFEALLSERVHDVVPRDFNFTEIDLLEKLSPEHQERFDDVRGWIRDGFVYGEDDLVSDVGSDSVSTLSKALSWTREGLRYSEADLRSDIGVDNEETLDTIVDWTRNGFTFTETDLREAIDDDRAFRELDRGRGYVATARSLSFLLYVLPFGLLAMVALLGGRGWRGRGMWAAAFLGVAAAILFAGAGPVFTNVALPEWDKAVNAWQGDTAGVALLALEKGVEVSQSVLDGFLAGLRRTGLIFFVGSFVGFLVLAVWPRGGMGVGRSGRGMVYETPPMPEPPLPPTQQTALDDESAAPSTEESATGLADDDSIEPADMPPSDDEPLPEPTASASESVLSDDDATEGPDSSPSDNGPLPDPAAEASESASLDDDATDEPDGSEGPQTSSGDEGSADDDRSPGTRGDEGTGRER